MSMPHLYGIEYSPWSYRARWALSWHDIAYRYTEFLPMIGKAAMRIRLNRWSDPITVPLAFVGERVLSDSLVIAQFADQIGKGPALQTDSEVVAEWNESAERFGHLGRVRVAHHIAADKRALKAAVPKPIRYLPGALTVGKIGARYMLKTYPVDVHEDHLETEMAAILSSFRAALNDRAFLMNTPSYADMIMASAMQMVDPVSSKMIFLEPAVEPHWRSERLASEYKDLCQWRDTVFSAMNAPQI